MITIAQGTLNKIILTLTEKATLSNPVFLFQFTNDQTRQAYFFIAADQSQFTYRYNEFQVTEKSSPNLLNGEVSLSTLGDYHYAVFEQNSSANLDPILAHSLLKTGKLTVLNGSSPTEIKYDSEPKTNIIYGE